MYVLNVNLLCLIMNMKCIRKSITIQIKLNTNTKASFVEIIILCKYKTKRLMRNYFLHEACAII